MFLWRTRPKTEAETQAQLARQAVRQLKNRAMARTKVLEFLSFCFIVIICGGGAALWLNPWFVLGAGVGLATLLTCGVMNLQRRWRQYSPDSRLGQLFDQLNDSAALPALLVATEISYALPEERNHLDATLARVIHGISPEAWAALEEEQGRVFALMEQEEAYPLAIGAILENEAIWDDRNAIPALRHLIRSGGPHSPLATLCLEKLLNAPEPPTQPSAELDSVIAKTLTRFRRLQRYEAYLNASPFIWMCSAPLYLLIKAPNNVQPQLKPIRYAFFGVMISSFGAGMVCEIIKRAVDRQALRSRKVEDVRVLIPLLQMLEERRRVPVRKEVLRLLANVKASDAALFDRKRKIWLSERLIGFAGKRPDEDIVLGILKALEQIGGEESVPAVEGLLKSRPLRQIEDAATACLATLKTNSQEAHLRATLLRPIEGERAPETLLRPAEAIAETESATLLRPQGESEPERTSVAVETDIQTLQNRIP